MVLNKYTFCARVCNQICSRPVTHAYQEALLRPPRARSARRPCSAAVLAPPHMHGRSCCARPRHACKPVSCKCRDLIEEKKRLWPRNLANVLQVGHPKLLRLPSIDERDVTLSRKTRTGTGTRPSLGRAKRKAPSPQYRAARGPLSGGYRLSYQPRPWVGTTSRGPTAGGDSDRSAVGDGGGAGDIVSVRSVTGEMWVAQLSSSPSSYNHRIQSPSVAPNGTRAPRPSGAACRGAVDDLV